MAALLGRMEVPQIKTVTLGLGETGFFLLNPGPQRVVLGVGDFLNYLQPTRLFERRNTNPGVLGWLLGGGTWGWGDSLAMG